MALEYWANQSHDINGVMGGLAHLHSIDIQTSTKFFDKLERILKKKHHKLLHFNYAADVGAGVGRVTEALLNKKYKSVHLFEPTTGLYNQLTKKFENVFHQTAQNFHPPHNAQYDCIWIQWTAMYLTNTELIHFLKHASHFLQSDGVIIVKDNVCEEQEDIFCEEDSSWARALGTWLAVFSEAEMDLILGERASGFPPNLYPIYIFALKKT